MTKKNWFFDLDGTLADTYADITACWRKTVDELGLDTERFDRLFTVGPSIDDITRKMYPERYSKELCEAVREGFSRHYDTGGFPLTKEYPGIIDEIKRLKSLGARVFVVTNKRWKAVRLISAHFGWDEVFDGFYASDMHKDDPIGVLKKPDLLALAMKENGCEASSCVMVGDTINDFDAAAANAVWSIAVPWGYGAASELARADVLYSGSGPLPTESV